MTQRLLVRHRARLDIAAASDWYDEQRLGLGLEFLDAIEARLRDIRDNPLQYQLFAGGLRKVLVRRFPYSIVYTVSADEIVILRCLHGHSDPRRWPSG